LEVQKALGEIARRLSALVLKYGLKIPDSLLRQLLIKKWDVLRQIPNLRSSLWTSIKKTLESGGAPTTEQADQFLVLSYGGSEICKGESQLDQEEIQERL
jgi:hypothetical protein